MKIPTYITRSILSFAISLACLGTVQADWQPIGPSPINDGGPEGITITNSTGAIKIQNPSVGAINAVVSLPNARNTLYVGTVNGGIWKTENANSSEPLWVPLTDQALPALSIASLAVSPLDDKWLFAGTGSTSSDAAEGSPGFGIARSGDGGQTWEVVASSTFKGVVVTSIIPAKFMENQQAVVLAASPLTGKGLYRSSNNGTTFTQISGAMDSGLPLAGVSSLIADPSNPQAFYAAVPALDASVSGIYRSEDGGKYWAKLKSLSPTVTRVMLSATGANRENNAVYFAEASNDKWKAIFKSSDQGKNWIALQNVPDVGDQASIHGSLLADPKDISILYFAGATHSKAEMKKLKCKEWSGAVYQYDGSNWKPLVCNAANNSAPHADSRSMTLDPNGNLLQVDDGGIYRLANTTNPANRIWESVLGNLSITEFISVAYDPNNGMVFGGTQDNHPITQLSNGDSAWKSLTSGDGGVVAVDANQMKHPGVSIRYCTMQYLDMSLSKWDSSGNLLPGTPRNVKLHIKGTNKAYTWRKGNDKVEIKPEFYNAYVLNAIDPTRMIIGHKAGVYESFNQGDTLIDVPTSSPIVKKTSYQKALSYGGRRAGQAYPDVFYAGFSSESPPEPTEDEDSSKNGTAPKVIQTPSKPTLGTILYRQNLGEKASFLPNYPGSGVVDLATDPSDYYTLFVLDDQSRIWVTYNEVDWSEVTGNLMVILPEGAVSLAIKGADSTSPGLSLIAGGKYGVAQLRSVMASGAGWESIDKGLPHALVNDVQYDQASHTLVAGTLGRGAWKVNYQ